MYISQPRTKFLLGDQNTLRKMYYLSDIIANIRIHKVLSHDVTSAILVSQKYMKRSHVGGSPTNLVRFEPFPCVKCFFCSNKFAYVADTSEGKGERTFSSQAWNAEMSGEYERRERILHIPFVLLFSPGNDSTFTSLPFFDPFRRLKSFFLSATTHMYLSLVITAQCC